MKQFTKENSSRVIYPRTNLLAGELFAALSLRLQPQSSQSYGQIFRHPPFYLMHEDVNTARLQVSVGSSGYWISYSAFTTSREQHLVIQYDGTQSTNATRVRVFVDDAELTMSTGGAVPSPLPGDVAPVAIGSDPTPAGFWTGRIGLIGVWRGVVLSAAQRTQLYQQVMPWEVEPQAMVFCDPLFQHEGARNYVSGEPGDMVAVTPYPDPAGLQPWQAPLVRGVEPWLAAALKVR